MKIRERKGRKPYIIIASRALVTSQAIRIHPINMLDRAARLLKHNRHAASILPSERRDVSAAPGPLVGGRRVEPPVARTVRDRKIEARGVAG